MSVSGGGGVRIDSAIELTLDLGRTVIAFVRRGGSDPRESALSAAKATIRRVHVSELAQDLEADVDAVVLAVDDEPEAFAAFVAALPPPSRPRPVVALVGEGVTAKRLSVLGQVAVVDANVEPASLQQKLAILIAGERSSPMAAAEERAEDAEARLRTLADRLSTAHGETQTLGHDVRVLCGIAMGYAANLRDGFAGPLDPSQSAHVVQIVSAVTDIGSLLDRFSAAVRVQLDATDGAVAARRSAPRRTSSDLVDLAANTVALFEKVAADKKLKLALTTNGPVRIFCDATQIKQAITNLVVNAIKFTPRGGSVTVDVGFCEAPASPHAVGVQARRHACITVRDTGPGVAPEDRERIFLRGVRAAQHVNVAGSGIGLAVVRDVARVHGGSVTVEEATAAGGASFRLILPSDLRRRAREGASLEDFGSLQDLLPSNSPSSRPGSQ